MSGITNGAYVLSNSEIQTFKDCRRKWWFTYYRRLKPKQQKVTGPLALGSRVHAALDEHYTNGTDLQTAYAKLLAEDRALVDGFGMDDFESEGELGRKMLEGYEEWVQDEGIDADLEMISTEEVISMPMFDGAVELQGKLDMRVRRKADGVRLFRDFKTVGGSFTEFASTAHMSEQILTYMLLERAKDQGTTDRSEGGIFTLLKKVRRSGTAKPPFYQQFEVRHNVFTLRAFWQRLHGVVADLMGVKTALDQGVSHLQVAYPRPSRDCKWKCSFFPICPMVDDGSAVEQAIENQYDVSDPYAYYQDGKQDVKGVE